MRILVLSTLLLLLVACSSDETTTISGGNILTESGNVAVDTSFDENFNTANPLALYLPEDKTIMTYTGPKGVMTSETYWESNESTSITTTLLDQLHTYHFDIQQQLHLTKDGIQTVYLTLPLEQTAGDWQHAETLQTLATPYDTFENVYVLQHESNDEIERHYIAYQYGIVQFEFIKNGQTTAYALQHIEYK